MEETCRNCLKLGANDGGRTRDIQDHNLALYRLSYVRRGLTVYPRRRSTATGYARVRRQRRGPGFVGG